MRSIHIHRNALLGLGIAALIGASALAAPAPNAPPRDLAPRANPAANPAQAVPGAPPARNYAEAYLEDWFTYQRNALRITEAQRPLWNRYEDAVRNNVRDRIDQRPEPRDRRAGPPPLTEVLAQRRQRLDAEQSRLAAYDAAIRPLYAALNEEQKRIADSVLTERPLAREGLRRGFERRMSRNRDDRDRRFFRRF